MKKFLKMMLAVICGILLLNILGLAIIAGIASIGNTSTPLEGLLRIDLSSIEIKEKGEASLNMSSLQSQSEPIGIYQAIKALDAAAEDPAIKAVYLKTDGASMGTGTIVEFRNALQSFRRSGKPVISYMENPSTGSLYLASVADKVYMGSQQGGSASVVGLSSRLIFLGDVLDALGIHVQLIRHGKYKSAGEMYIRGNASPENIEQNQALVDALWESLGGELANSRDITLAQLDQLIDSLGLCLPQDFVDAGLVDALLDRQGLEEKLAIFSQVPSYSKVKMVPFKAYVDAKAASVPSLAKKKIAVVYADGEIVEGVDLNNVDGDRFASILESVRQDSTVKAVVLRVNSPGGSVSAAEKIKNEIDLIAQTRPVIASYGDYAASGGYWISCGADKIFSQPTTLTGSIGVFGMVPEIGELLSDRLHVGVQTIKSHAHGDMFSFTRPLDEDELEYMQRSIETIYTRFINLVAEGRGLEPAQVDSIAQGRVWAGSDALKIGLVDEIGGLVDALNYAAIAAGGTTLSDFGVVEYPKAMTPIESLTSLVDKSEQDYSVSAWKSWYEDFMSGNTRSYIFASMPYCVEIR